MNGYEKLYLENEEFRELCNNHDVYFIDGTVSDIKLRSYVEIIEYFKIYKYSYSFYISKEELDFCLNKIENKITKQFIKNYEIKNITINSKIIFYCKIPYNELVLYKLKI